MTANPIKEDKWKALADKSNADAEKEMKQLKEKMNRFR